MTDWGGVVVVTTPRLVLRTFRPDDLPLYAQLNADPLVYEWLGGEPMSRENSDDIAAWAQDLFAAEASACLRSSGEPTACSWGCAACTTRSPTPTTSRWPSGWPAGTGAPATPPKPPLAGSTSASAGSGSLESSP